MAVDIAVRAHHRDRDATVRDAQARMVDDALAVDPAAYDAKAVARLAAKDRRAAAVDRQAAADDRGELIHALLGDCGGVPADGDRAPGLRPREREVLDRLARGLTAKEIAEDLYLSVNTVKTHTRNLYRRLGVRSRVAATNWARDNGYGRP
jgi:LuxR family maltose regulon positive regulatory protein